MISRWPRAGTDYVPAERPVKGPLRAPEGRDAGKEHAGADRETAGAPGGQLAMRSSQRHWQVNESAARRARQARRRHPGPRLMTRPRGRADLVRRPGRDLRSPRRHPDMQERFQSPFAPAHPRSRRTAQPSPSTQWEYEESARTGRRHRPFRGPKGLFGAPCTTNSPSRRQVAGKTRMRGSRRALPQVPARNPTTGITRTGDEIGAPAADAAQVADVSAPACAPRALLTASSEDAVLDAAP